MIVSKGRWSPNHSELGDTREILVRIEPQNHNNSKYLFPVKAIVNCRGCPTSPALAPYTPPTLSTVCPTNYYGSRRDAPSWPRMSVFRQPGQWKCFMNGGYATQFHRGEPWVHVTVLLGARNRTQRPLGADQHEKTYAQPRTTHISLISVLLCLIFTRLADRPDGYPPRRQRKFRQVCILRKT